MRLCRRWMWTAATAASVGCGSVTDSGGPESSSGQVTADTLLANFDGKSAPITVTVGSGSPVTVMTKVSISKGILDDKSVSLFFESFPVNGVGYCPLNFQSSGGEWAFKASDIVSDCNGTIGGEGDSYDFKPTSGAISADESTATFTLTGSACNRTGSPDCTPDTAFSATATFTK